MTEEEYRLDSTRINNSMLGWVMSGLKYYLKKVNNLGKDEPRENFFDFGDAVHHVLLRKHEFAKKFFVRKEKQPSNAIQSKFCSLLISSDRISAKSLITAYKLSYSIKGKTEEAIELAANNLYKEWADYINEQKNAGDKIELSLSQYESIKRIENNVASNMRASFLLYDESPEKKAFNEHIVLFDFHKKPFKAILDRLVIDFRNKKITIIDIKTSSTKREDVNLIESFRKSFDLYDYDRQLYLYTAAAFSFFSENFPEENIEEYQIEHKIILIRSNFDNDVYVLNIKEDLLERGESKFNEALKRYDFYTEHNFQIEYGLNKNGEIDLYE